MYNVPLSLFQLALAEEYKKPIITLRLEAVAEIDPGLKLIIQKRQVQDENRVCYKGLHVVASCNSQVINMCTYVHERSV